MARTHTDGDLDHGIAFPLTNSELLVECAVAADEAGWDGVFFQDHLTDWLATEPADHRAIADTWTTLSAIASRTDRITLASWITPVPRRYPWQLARNLATLDRISNGRVLLGAGLGTTPDFTTFGLEADQTRRARKLDEALEIIDRLWTGDPVTYDGDHFTITDAVLRPTPVQEPRIPIVIGGWWPYKKPFQRGARWDGIMPNWPSMVDEDADMLEELGDHIQEAVARQRSNETEVREMLEYYRSRADEPGEIVLPVEMSGLPPDFLEVCRDVGATWALSTPVDPADSIEDNVARIREGPPE